jgi:hypothetical protein
MTHPLRGAVAGGRYGAAVVSAGQTHLRRLRTSRVARVVLVSSLAVSLWSIRDANAASRENLEAWAYPQRAEVIRKAPSETAETISKLRLTTELGNAEVYRVSERLQVGDDPVWLRIDVLGRPNGRLGWVPESALGMLHSVKHKLVIRRSALRATLLDRGKRVWSAPVGIGEGRWPTPGGSFYVREAIRIRRGGGVYGSFAFGLSAYSPGLSDWPGGGVVGIHGTNEPGLIPGRISHGCIRVRNQQINRLKRLMDVGTPVLIR